MSKEKKMNVTLPGENNGNFIKIIQLHLEQYLPYSFRVCKCGSAPWGTVVTFRKIRKLKCFEFI
jgi:hypothetical protein